MNRSTWLSKVFILSLVWAWPLCVFLSCIFTPCFFAPVAVCGCVIHCICICVFLCIFVARNSKPVFATGPPQAVWATNVVRSARHPRGRWTGGFPAEQKHRKFPPIPKHRSCARPPTLLPGEGSRLQTSGRVLSCKCRFHFHFWLFFAIFPFAFPFLAECYLSSVVSIFATINPGKWGQILKENGSPSQMIK